MEHWWNDSGRVQLKCSEKCLSLCHMAHHKSDVDWLGIEPRSPQWEAGD
jgi:hypothetical protein